MSPGEGAGEGELISLPSAANHREQYNTRKVALSKCALVSRVL